MSKLIMIRHPEYDAASRLAPLTGSGYAQARRIAAMLRDAGLGRIKLVSSPAARTKALAAVIADATGVPVQTADWAMTGPDSPADVLAYADWEVTDTVVAASHEPALRQALTAAGVQDHPEIAYGSIVEFDFDPSQLRLTCTRLRA